MIKHPLSQRHPWRLWPETSGLEHKSKGPAEADLNAMAILQEALGKVQWLLQELPLSLQLAAGLALASASHRLERAFGLEP